MQRPLGYTPYAVSPEQDAALSAIVERAGRAPDQRVAVFDLDGCMFDNRHRQIRLIRELASAQGWWDLYGIDAEHIRDWSQQNTLRRAGLSDARIDQVMPALREKFMSCFFHSDYVQSDHAMPGAAELVRACYAAGSRVVYLTGRHAAMRPGTELALRRFGFPYGERARLITKPDFKTPDEVFKEAAVAEISQEGEPVIFLDNEPTNVNLFRRMCPEALVVFVATDHSPRPVQPHPEMPRIAGFLRQG